MPNARSKNKKYVSAWISKPLYASLKNVAKRQNRPLSTLMDELLTNYADSQPLTLGETSAIVSSAKIEETVSCVGKSTARRILAARVKKP